MTQAWLKTLGTAKAPVPDDWRAAHDGALLHTITFRRRPSMEPGHRIALYAAGWRAVFAAGTITTLPYEQEGEDPWPWRVGVHLTHGVALIHDGMPLSALTAEPPLSRSIRQKSHIRISSGEHAAITSTLPALDTRAPAPS